MKMIAKIFGEEPNGEKDIPERLSFFQTITPALAAFPEPATRSVVIVIEKDHSIGPDLRWPLRMARIGDGDITVLFGMKNRSGSVYFNNILLFLSGTSAFVKLPF